ncbi:MAG: hypothetical protein J2P38_04240, partial [Candidatus Dormibacteraeota bacterium]|nr:hypothetical protein [Candidatus Dormibacteraeota bacterium]
ATVPTGTMTINAPDVARLLLSFRPTGADGLAATVTTLTRFAGFFATRVLLAFSPVGPSRPHAGRPLDPEGPSATPE